jgi:hypothetical protein
MADFYTRVARIDLTPIYAAPFPNRKLRLRLIECGFLLVPAPPKKPDHPPKLRGKWKTYTAPGMPSILVIEQEQRLTRANQPRQGGDDGDDQGAASDQPDI